MLSQSGLEKAGLLTVDAIARRVLLRCAVEQDFLQFLHRAGVNHRYFAIPQARVVLAGQNQPLNIRR
jgi:hypothetical protein